MEKEIDDLKLEIEVLKKRVKTLEGDLHKRRIIKIVKSVAILILIAVVGFYGYQMYGTLMEKYQTLQSQYDKAMQIVSKAEKWAGIKF